MKVFMYEKLENGVWEPWFLRQCDFRRALLFVQGEIASTCRIRRVKTQEEFDEAVVQGVKLYRGKDIDMRKVEWAT